MTEPAEDTPVLDLLANMTAASLAASSLDPETLALVRVAALVALDAPAGLLHPEPGSRSRTWASTATGSAVYSLRSHRSWHRTRWSPTGKIVEALAIEIEIAELVAEQADA